MSPAARIFGGVAVIAVIVVAAAVWFIRGPGPPAYCLPPCVVWQTMQSAALARYSPRSIRLAFSSAGGTPEGFVPR